MHAGRGAGHLVSCCVLVCRCVCRFALAKTRLVLGYHAQMWNWVKAVCCCDYYKDLVLLFFSPWDESVVTRQWIEF